MRSQETGLTLCDSCPLRGYLASQISELIFSYSEETQILSGMFVDSGDRCSRAFILDPGMINAESLDTICESLVDVNRSIFARIDSCEGSVYVEDHGEVCGSIGESDPDSDREQQMQLVAIHERSESQLINANN